MRFWPWRKRRRPLTLDKVVEDMIMFGGKLITVYEHDFGTVNVKVEIDGDPEVIRQIRELLFLEQERRVS